jgi:hypothetical protein
MVRGEGAAFNILFLSIARGGLMFRRKSRKLVPARKCGHLTLLQDEVVQINGERQKMKLSPGDDGKVEYCLECLAGMAVRCAWCRNLVLVGDPITLYSPRDTNFVSTEGAVTYSTEPLRLVGCLRWDCAQTGADRAGFWLPDGDGKGHVRRVPTAFEQLFGGQLEGSMELVASSDPSQNQPTRQVVFPIPEEA